MTSEGVRHVELSKVITKLIIASAGLWLALPAAAQFEIDPDHFDDPATNVVQPRPEQSKGAMRISLPYKQVQRHRVQTFKGRKGPANALRTLSGAAGVHHRGVSGASGVAREPADRKASEQSRPRTVAPPIRLGASIALRMSRAGPSERIRPICWNLMFDAYAGHAGERSFRDFFRLPPTKENRRQSVDPACRLCRAS